MSAGTMEKAQNGYNLEHMFDSDNNISVKQHSV